MAAALNQLLVYHTVQLLGPYLPTDPGVGVCEGGRLLEVLHGKAVVPLEGVAGACLHRTLHLAQHLGHQTDTGRLIQRSCGKVAEAACLGFFFYGGGMTLRRQPSPLASRERSVRMASLASRRSATARTSSGSRAHDFGSALAPRGTASTL